MSLRIYNSLSKVKDEWASPKKAKPIRMYSCGVTVYDECHIGHARSLYTFDVIKRYLQFKGYDIRFIRNITDIDDKIINKAKELHKKWSEVVEENIALYQKDLQTLGIPQTTPEPRATENIDRIIDVVTQLIDKGFAYEVDGDVYYAVRRFKDYGKLSGQSIEKMLEGVRIDSDEKKKDPLDFALWKKSKEGEPFWESPWGQGRPGWHIECSCMSLKHLDCETLDIHAGGRDLIFPHHENEIAQSEALTGKPFARAWIHHGLLTINGQKMSKSLKNFITIQEAVKKYSVDQLKFFFLSSHYASTIDFSESKMQEAHKALERIRIFFHEGQHLDPQDSSKLSQEPDFIKNRQEEFLEAMDDDFNTPRALGAIFEMITDTYKLKEDKNYPAIVCKISEIILKWGKDIFGLFESDGGPQETVEKLTKDIETLLRQREKARSNKDFKRSDEIRDELKTKGIIVEDGKDGQRWRKA